MKRFKKGIGTALIIACMGLAAATLLAARQEDKYLPETSRRPLLVETIPVKKRDYQIQVPAYGFVEPKEIIHIRPEISGKITDVAPDVFAGGRVKKGAFLFSMDDRDYQYLLTEATAEGEQARQTLEMEKGRQAVAREEWLLLKNSKWEKSKNKSLALREPQLKERKAAVKMAAAKKARAALALERTRLTAPCDGVILWESCAKGQVLDAGFKALEIACTDRYQITAFYSPEYSPDTDSDPVRVNVGPNRFKGVLKAVLPKIDPETGRKQALVEFEGKRIFLGDYASLTLYGPVFKNALVIPKQALRSENTVWVFGENKTLEIRKVTVPARDMENVIIGQGLFPNDFVVLSHLANPLAGMKLIKKGDTHGLPGGIVHKEPGR